MPIKTVAIAEAPLRMFKRGVISSKQDYLDVMNALQKANAGQAIIVTMESDAWKGVEKPETAFANSLRRSFEAKGLQLTAYQSGKMEVTVRKVTALDPKRKPRSK